MINEQFWRKSRCSKLAFYFSFNQIECTSLYAMNIKIEVDHYEHIYKNWLNIYYSWMRKWYEKGCIKINVCGTQRVNRKLFYQYCLLSSIVVSNKIKSSIMFCTWFLKSSRILLLIYVLIYYWLSHFGVYHVREIFLISKGRPY